MLQTPSTLTSMPLIDLSADRTVQRNPFSGFLEPRLPNFEWIDRTHPDRPSLERFIADVFARQYGARVSHYMDVLIGYRTSEEGWAAAVGFSPLVGKTAFLEQYLDRPVEQMISRSICSSGAEVCARSDIVEFGNLASVHPGVLRSAILQLTEWLYSIRMHWVVFTATKKIKNSFSRLHYNPVKLAVADPRRLGVRGSEWGSYYENSPLVMFGDVNAAYARFSKSIKS